MFCGPLPFQGSHKTFTPTTLPLHCLLHEKPACGTGFTKTQSLLSCYDSDIICPPMHVLHYWSLAGNPILGGFGTYQRWNLPARYMSLQRMVIPVWVLCLLVHQDVSSPSIMPHTMNSTCLLWWRGLSPLKPWAQINPSSLKWLLSDAAITEEKR